MRKDIVERPLKDVIIEILKSKGNLSIHSLWERLERRGINIHRLELTGYLKALRDMGILKETFIKPAKVYSVVQVKKRSIYQIVGDKAREINEEEAADICLYTLYKLFNRPIFLRELNRAGVGVPENGDRVVGKERQQALRMLQDAGFDVPRNNSAFVPKKEYRQEFTQIITEMLIESYNLRSYVNRDVKQMKIDSDSIE